jgi:hypothetical protein
LLRPKPAQFPKEAVVHEEKLYARVKEIAWCGGQFSAIFQNCFGLFSSSMYINPVTRHGAENDLLTVSWWNQRKVIARSGSSLLSSAFFAGVPLLVRAISPKEPEKVGKAGPQLGWTEMGSAVEGFSLAGSGRVAGRRRRLANQFS